MELKLRRRILPHERRSILKNLLDKKGFARILEAHNGLSAIIANNIKEINNNEIQLNDVLDKIKINNEAIKNKKEELITKGYDPDTNQIIITNQDVWQATQQENTRKHKDNNSTNQNM